MTDFHDGNIKGVLRTKSNIYSGAFNKFVERLKTVNYFSKKLHPGCLNTFLNIDLH